MYFLVSLLGLLSYICRFRLDNGIKNRKINLYFGFKYEIIFSFAMCMLVMKLTDVLMIFFYFSSFMSNLFHFQTTLVWGYVSVVRFLVAWLKSMSKMLQMYSNFCVSLRLFAILPEILKKEESVFQSFLLFSFICLALSSCQHKSSTDCMYWVWRWFWLFSSGNLPDRLTKNAISPKVVDITSFGRRESLL